ncbi:hypothetical protein [Maribacter spongiicola]|uniref:hypothetical protein n=1 Tax=Maribacter spongiicola TaxID=1206753 RepID=UPI003F974963
MKLKAFYYIVVISLVASCSSSDQEPNLEEVINDPVEATLIFPEDKTECNEGTILSDTESKVIFRWNSSEFTDSYELKLKNLETDIVITQDAINDSKEVTISRGTSYEWYIISKSIESDATATSEVFQFFNAAPGVVNHIPFSAEAIAPIDNEILVTNDTFLSLEWQASDIDDDIKEYEIFFGTSIEEMNNIGSTANTKIEVDIIFGSTYYWKVRTYDENFNSSESDVFQFTVQ